MALRCERCRTADLVLERFGVYQCPNCGRVDADGNLLDAGAPDRGDSTQPNLLETGRASFAAPPPAPAASPIASTLGTTAAPIAKGELPQVFLATLVVVVLIDAAGAIASHNLCTLTGLIVFYGALLTGKRWARTLSMAGAVLTIGLCGMVCVLPHVPPTLRGACAVVIVANAWWMYVLLRPDTVTYFSR